MWVASGPHFQRRHRHITIADIHKYLNLSFSLVRTIELHQVNSMAHIDNADLELMLKSILTRLQTASTPTAEYTPGIDQKLHATLDEHHTHSQSKHRARLQSLLSLPDPKVALIKVSLMPHKMII